MRRIKRSGVRRSGEERARSIRREGRALRYTSLQRVAPFAKLIACVSKTPSAHTATVSGLWVRAVLDTRWGLLACFSGASWSQV